MDWQRERCDLIELRIRSLCAELERIQARIAELKAAVVAAEQQVLHGHRIDGASLAGLAAFRLRQASLEQSLNKERQGVLQRLAEQRALWVEAKKRYRVLERLKARKHTDYAYEFDKEIEQIAAEAYAARWHSEHRPLKSLDAAT